MVAEDSKRNLSGREVILIIGMMRSGTSALTRVLSLCGCGLPRSVLGPQDWNPTGNWDPAEALKLNTDFLLRHNTALGDPTMHFHDLEIAGEEVEKYVGEIQSFLRDNVENRALVLKEQCITELMKYWLLAIERSGAGAKVVIPVRCLPEVMASFAALSSDIPREFVSLVWLKYNLLAERNSRGLPRVFVEYSNLVKHWRTEMARVARALNLALRMDDYSKVDSFLTPNLYHQRTSEPLEEAFGQRWCSRVYEIFRIAAEDGPIDTSGLDEIYASYCDNERTFRIARDEFQRQFDPSKLRETHSRLQIWQAGRDF